MKIRRADATRSAILCVAAVLLVAADDPTPPPAALAPYIHEGRFVAGDYRWLRGMLPDATPAQKAEWATIAAYRKACHRAGNAVVRARLNALGIANPVTQASGASDPVCVDLSYATADLSSFDSAEQLDAAVAVARPVATAVVWTAALAQAVADPDEPTLASELRARPMTDQVLRNATSWNEGDHKGAPDLPPAERWIVHTMLWSAIHDRDAANTRWLRDVIDRQGWPTISVVGKEAATDAWLLAQHADEEPDFQLRVLRLMEPLVATKEVSEKNFAFLYDRVMLQLTGKQRYGTQLDCATGHWAPASLEDPDKVPALRKAAGMNTLAENAARIERSAGPCPAAK